MQKRVVQSTDSSTRGKLNKYTHIKGWIFFSRIFNVRMSNATKKKKTFHISILSWLLNVSGNGYYCNELLIHQT